MESYRSDALSDAEEKNPLTAFLISSTLLFVYAYSPPAVAAPASGNRRALSMNRGTPVRVLNARVCMWRRIMTGMTDGRIDAARSVLAARPGILYANGSWIDVEDRG